MRASVVDALLSTAKPWRAKFDVGKPLPFLSKHVISAEQFDRDSIQYVMRYADLIDGGLKLSHGHSLLSGKVQANVFLEPSTRTATSFAVSMMRSGGSVFHISAETSSVQKGETLEDTIRTLESYADVIVLRHPTLGAADVAASVATGNVPIINAGDGGGEHPTQALLDLYSIHSRFGGLESKRLHMTLLGDLKYGRTVHSLAQMLSHFPNIELSLVSPPNLGMPKEYLQILQNRNVKFSVQTNLEGVLSDTDILYQTRVQKERFTDANEYAQSKGKFVVTPSTMAMMKKESILMHPFPRVDEILESVDSDARAWYFKQPAMGIRARMALLGLVLGKEPPKRL